MTHVLFAATVPFVNESEVAPAAGTKVGEPQPAVVAAGGFATVMFGGRLSVKLYPLTVAGFGLVKVIFSAETPLTVVVLGAKLFEIPALSEMKDRR